MFGNHFYHQRIRNAVAVFGSLFNNLNVVRKNSSGAVISQVKVPLSYAPRRDFLARLDAMTNGEQGERQIAIKLPRMSFEIVSMQYDAQRQLPKTNNCVIPSSTYGDSTKLYTPVPYNINFQLNIYAKGQDDALQCVEQILPYFTPSYTVTMKPLDDFDGVKEDVPISLQGISFSDDFEGALESRRTVIYTLDFEMKVSMYKSIGTKGPIILKYDIENLQLNGDELFSITDSAAIASPLSGTTLEDTKFTANPFNISNVPLTSHGLQIGTSPSNGTAVVNYQKKLVSSSGIVVAIGDYSYTPDSDFHGTDTFTIDLLYGDSANPSTIEKTINITIESVRDLSESIGPFQTAVGFVLNTNISDQNTFTNATYSIVSAPSRGTASVGSSSGIITYTASSVGSDTLTCRVTPQSGTAEDIIVNYTVIAGDVLGGEGGETPVYEDSDGILL